MTSASHAGLVDRLVPWIGGALLALPVLLVAYPPMADMPLHEASVGLLRHWGDAHFAPPSIYFLNLGHSNQLFPILVFVLAHVVPIAWATKIVVAGSILGLTVAAASFADHLGSSRWTALLVGPLGLGWLFFWGLIQNILGLAILLAILPSLDRFALRPTWRGVAQMCAAMVLLHFAHQAMQLVAFMALVLCSVGFPLREKAMALRALPAAFCLALVYAATRYAWHFAGPLHKAMLLFQWASLSYKLQTIPGVLFAGYAKFTFAISSSVLAVVPVALIAAARAHPGSRSRIPRPVLVRIHGWRFELLGLALFGLFLAAPSAITSTTLRFYHRFLPPAWAILAVAVGAHTKTIARSFHARFALFWPLASLLVAWPSFAGQRQVYTGLEALLPHMEPGSAVMALSPGAPTQSALGAHGRHGPRRGRARRTESFRLHPVPRVAGLATPRKAVGRGDCASSRATPMTSAPTGILLDSAISSWHHPSERWGSP